MSKSLPNAVLLMLAVPALACSGGSEGGTSDPPPVEEPEKAFLISLDSDRLPVLQGAANRMGIRIERRAGFHGAVEISAENLPPGAKLAPLTIAADETEAELTLSAPASAPHSLPTLAHIVGKAGDVSAERDLTVTVYGKPGALDTSFAGGKVILPVGNSDDYAYAITTQKDGKLLIAGRSAERLGDVALIRLTQDGALDATFGSGGRVTMDLAGAADCARAVAVDAKGRIVIAGTSERDGRQDFLVARYMPSGELDESFGDQGHATVGFGSEDSTAYAMVLQADGKLVVVGDANVDVKKGLDFALARFTSDGQLDPNFGDAGKITQSVAAGNGRDSAYAVALQDVAGEQRLVLAGGEGDFSLARFTAAGALDTSFGAQGSLKGLLGSSIGAAKAVQVDADGNIVVAGHHTNDFALLRLDPNGALDASFGNQGALVTPINPKNWDGAEALAIDPDGSIVAAGWAYDVGSSANTALVRYMPNGELDTAFGEGGVALTQVAAATKSDQGSALLLQTDQRVPTTRILVAGYASTSAYDFAVTRFWR